MESPIFDTRPTPLAAAPPQSTRLPLRQGRELLSVLVIDAAGLYFTGGILGILLGFTASIFLSHIRRLGR
ncbi:MAG: hypothetical protein QM757_18545 [Paludibaculum sp.]